MLNSATTSLGKPADNPWTSPEGHKSGRAALVASRKTLEASRQASLARSEARRRSAGAKRRLGYGNPPPGSAPPRSRGELHGEEAELKSGDVLPPGGPFAGGYAREERRVATLEAELEEMKARVGAMQFSVDGLTSDLSSFQDSQEAATGEILALLRGGQNAKDNQVAGPQQGVRSEDKKQLSRLEELERNRRDGKLQCSDDEFEILRRALGKTSSKVKPFPPSSSFLSSGLSSKGFSSFGLDDFPTNTEGDGYSSFRMDEIRAMRANKSKLPYTCRT